MILDHELSQLSKPETGVLGSLGFVCLGTALGLAPSFSSVLSRLEVRGVEPLTRGDATTLVIFGAVAVGATVCLALFVLMWWRNRGLADTIRRRAAVPVSGGLGG